MDVELSMTITGNALSGNDGRTQNLEQVPSVNATKSEITHSDTKGAEQRITMQREQLDVMAQKLQDFVGSLNTGLEFSVDEDSGRDVIKVIDRDSREVIRQYPSEEVLDLVANLSDAAGNLVNSKA